MNRWHGWLVLALVPAFGQVPSAQAGSIYKCTVKGSTIYQDQPCSADKPDAGKLSGTTDPLVGNDPGALIEGIRDLAERDRGLRARHDRELEQLRARMAGVDDEQTQRREVDEFNRSWQGRFTENRQRQQALLDRLRELCPGGASGGSGRHTCNRAR